ncbi:DUF3182 family protein, partial [Salmonella enterica]|uniref:DUF3182 family protein n=1 Tax=Salmonella enterica TaxID=28901 RepID=UPI003FA7DCE3
PPGWCPGFAQDVEHAVLPGYSAFTMADALEAGLRLLAEGPVRVKRPEGVGGAGQWVVTDQAGLARCIEALPAGEIAQQGLVLERNLESLETFSIGQVQLGWQVASY